MARSNPLIILDKKFLSQAKAKEYFDPIRLDSFNNKTTITEGENFLLLKEAYKLYCQYTNWKIPADPIGFYARNIGKKGGTTIGFGINFPEGTEFRKDKDNIFSIDNAIKEIAKYQNS